MKTLGFCTLRLFLLTTTVLGGHVFGGTVEDAANGGVVWNAGVDGVQIEYDADGSFNRVYSKYTQPVNFPDRKGIHTAQVIAEEKAKAAITRFLNQMVSSENTTNIVSSDLDTAVRVKSDDTDSMAKTTTRKEITELREFTRSYSSGSLRGVVVLEQGYDEKKEEVWVKVGISKKTVAAAASLQSGISGQPARATKQDTALSPDNADSTKLSQPSEVKKVDDDKW